MVELDGSCVFVRFFERLYTLTGVRHRVDAQSYSRRRAFWRRKADSRLTNVRFDLDYFLAAACIVLRCVVGVRFEVLVGAPARFLAKLDEHVVHDVGRLSRYHRGLAPFPGRAVSPL